MSNPMNWDEWREELIIRIRSLQTTKNEADVGDILKMLDSVSMTDPQSLWISRGEHPTATADSDDWKTAFPGSYTTRTIISFLNDRLGFPFTTGTGLVRLISAQHLRHYAIDALVLIDMRDGWDCMAGRALPVRIEPHSRSAFQSAEMYVVTMSTGKILPHSNLVVAPTKNGTIAGIASIKRANDADRCHVIDASVQITEFGEIYEDMKQAQRFAADWNDRENQR